MAARSLRSRAFEPSSVDFVYTLRDKVVGATILTMTPESGRGDDGGASSASSGVAHSS